MLFTRGRLWVDDVALTTVDDSVAVTGENSTDQEYSSYPTNLGFED